MYISVHGLGCVLGGGFPQGAEVAGAPGGVVDEQVQVGGRVPDRQRAHTLVVEEVVVYTLDGGIFTQARLKRNLFCDFRPSIHILWFTHNSIHALIIPSITLVISLTRRASELKF